MKKLRLDREAAGDGGLKILCLGAHSDDIEIGCSGAILKLLREHPGSRVRWVVLSGSDGRDAEARISAESLLTNAVETEILVAEFEDGYFPYNGSVVKRFFEERVKVGFDPDVIFTHRGDDRHQDHRVVSELTWNTFRDHLILEYEVIKYDGDLGQPQVFVELTEEICRQKVDNLLDSFPSQRGKRWFTADSFRGLLAVRGVEAAASTGFAEAFHARKIVLEN